MANDQEVKYLVPGLERGLQLLLAFGEQHRDLTFAELHRLVDMPKATAYRVVQTLEYMGFLERNARTNTFSLGMNVLRLGFEYIASLDVAQVGQPSSSNYAISASAAAIWRSATAATSSTSPASAPPVRVSTRSASERGYRCTAPRLAACC
ncbi:IclR family transcriptional regulator [Klebsiella pneumoniae]|uniref:IclR family transcriptional regulator n=1 Tax=Klebsiella pneumoniae TaxID=573 RepID=A0A378BTG6_KLEPN|nr:IclR family transcriptional regulator [Klebsiella pneumoniae]